MPSGRNTIGLTGKNVAIVVRSWGRTVDGIAGGVADGKENEDEAAQVGSSKDSLWQVSITPRYSPAVNVSKLL
jgi:hypothetical protein